MCLICLCTAYLTIDRQFFAIKVKFLVNEYSIRKWYYKGMKQKVLRAVKVLLPWMCTLLLLLLSSPSKLPSAVLILPFLLLFIAIYTTALEILHLLRGGEQNRVVGMRASRPRLISGLFAGFPVLLLVLQSIGQLTAWDVLTVVALFIVAYFYIIKSSVIFPGL